MVVILEPCSLTPLWIGRRGVHSNTTPMQAPSSPRSPASAPADELALHQPPPATLSQSPAAAPAPAAQSTGPIRLRMRLGTRAESWKTRWTTRRQRWLSWRLWTHLWTAFFLRLLMMRLRVRLRLQNPTSFSMVKRSQCRRRSSVSRHHWMRMGARRRRERRRADERPSLTGTRSGSLPTRTRPGRSDGDWTRRPPQRKSTLDTHSICIAQQRCRHQQLPRTPANRSRCPLCPVFPLASCYCLRRSLLLIHLRTPLRAQRLSTRSRRRRLARGSRALCSTRVWPAIRRRTCRSRQHVPRSSLNAHPQRHREPHTEHLQPACASRLALLPLLPTRPLLERRPRLTSLLAASSPHRCRHPVQRVLLRNESRARTPLCRPPLLPWTTLSGAWRVWASMMTTWPNSTIWNAATSIFSSKYDVVLECIPYSYGIFVQ